MTAESKRAIVLTAASVLIGVGLALAGGQALFAAAVAVAFGLQWLVFLPSLALRTERYFDLTGSLTFILVTLGLLALSPYQDARSWLLAALVVAWAARLGAFLFTRVRRDGGDDRFTEIKASPLRFFSVWTTQGLWVSFTAAAAWIGITSPARAPLDWSALLGLLLWLLGFGIEVMADAQKRRFRQDPANRGRFISSGLWGRSRHPNYFGEIVAWVGVALLAAPTFVGWQWVGVLSPVFVALLLIKVSGIPLLEARADAKWGGQQDYETYKQGTPILVPRLSR